VGSALTGLWALGHVVVLGLLSALIHHHVEVGATGRTDSSESALDTPPQA
jgi:hypothetical protein